MSEPRVERRRAPRTEVLGELTVSIDGSPVGARVREISEGGFALETDAAPPTGVQRFTLQFGSLDPVEIVAESVHATRVSLPGAAPVFLAGFEFLPCSAGTAARLTALVEGIARRCAA